jgi:hypothetical protein
VSASAPPIVTTDRSDSIGDLTIGANQSGTFEATVSGASVVSRKIVVSVPGPNARVTLISSSFDLAAFDQLCRQPSIRRWVSSPTVVVEQRLLSFTTLDTSSYPVATIDPVSLNDGQAAGVSRQMEGILSDLTAGTWRSLGGAQAQEAPANGSVNLLIPGQITVARVRGMAASVGYGGFTRIGVLASGEIAGAMILLDEKYDLPDGDGPYSRVMRQHEFGHAMGLSHVTGRQSLMNPSAGAGLTSWDREALSIAWHRPIGNASPDIDPSTTRVNRAGGSIQWTRGEGSRP